MHDALARSGLRSLLLALAAVPFGTQLLTGQDTPPGAVDASAAATRTVELIVRNHAELSAAGAVEVLWLDDVTHESRLRPWDGSWTYDRVEALVGGGRKAPG